MASLCWTRTLQLCRRHRLHSWLACSVVGQQQMTVLQAGSLCALWASKQMTVLQAGSLCDLWATHMWTTCWHAGSRSSTILTQ